MNLKILLSILDEDEYLTIVHYFGLLGYKRLKPGQTDQLFFEMGVTSHKVKDFSYYRREKAMIKIRAEIQEKKINIDQITNNDDFKAYLSLPNYYRNSKNPRKTSRRAGVLRPTKPKPPKKIRTHNAQQLRQQRYQYTIRLPEFKKLVSDGKSALEIKTIMKIDSSFYGKLCQKADVNSKEITPEDFFKKWKTN